MTKKRTSMRKIREILRLKYHLEQKHRQIGKSLSISASSVSRIVNDAKAKGLTWPLPEGLSDAELEVLVWREISKYRQAHYSPRLGQTVKRAAKERCDKKLAVGGI